MRVASALLHRDSRRLVALAFRPEGAPEVPAAARRSPRLCAAREFHARLAAERPCEGAQPHPSRAGLLARKEQNLAAERPRDGAQETQAHPRKQQRSADPARWTVRPSGRPAPPSLTSTQPLQSALRQRAIALARKAAAKAASVVPAGSPQRERAPEQAPAQASARKDTAARRVAKRRGTPPPAASPDTPTGAPNVASPASTTATEPAAADADAVRSALITQLEQASEDQLRKEKDASRTSAREQRAATEQKLAGLDRQLRNHMYTLVRVPTLLKRVQQELRECASTADSDGRRAAHTLAVEATSNAAAHVDMFCDLVHRAQCQLHQFCAPAGSASDKVLHEPKHFSQSARGGPPPAYATGFVCPRANDDAEAGIIRKLVPSLAALKTAHLVRAMDWTLVRGAACGERVHVPDTCYLLNFPQMPASTSACRVVIPFTVLAELQNHSNKGMKTAAEALREVASAIADSSLGAVCIADER
eukprot:TRINITY_DN18654_c0_g1_i1.p1 TRINITY_DN18654_c0_g1~~TRINITY_DN18654_c0_g1_i1.p1  ORF type:complete len:478 (+),score=71.65 TRINITY_DN18654_c0_g1_i1:59-1492(+)